MAILLYSCETDRPFLGTLRFRLVLALVAWVLSRAKLLRRRRTTPVQAATSTRRRQKLMSTACNWPQMCRMPTPTTLAQAAGTATRVRRQRLITLSLRSVITACKWPKMCRMPTSKWWRTLCFSSTLKNCANPNRISPHCSKRKWQWTPKPTKVKIKTLQNERSKIKFKLFC